MTTRSSTSKYMPPPPGKVIPQVNTFRNVATVGVVPLGAMQPGPNAGAPGQGDIGGTGSNFAVIPSILG